MLLWKLERCEDILLGKLERLKLKFKTNRKVFLFIVRNLEEFRSGESILLARKYMRMKTQQLG